MGRMSSSSPSTTDCPMRPSFASRDTCSHLVRSASSPRGSASDLRGSALGSLGTASDTRRRPASDPCSSAPTSRRSASFPSALAFTYRRSPQGHRVATSQRLDCFSGERPVIPLKRLQSSVWWRPASNPKRCFNSFQMPVAYYKKKDILQKRLPPNVLQQRLEPLCQKAASSTRRIPSSSPSTELLLQMAVPSPRLVSVHKKQDSLDQKRAFCHQIKDFINKNKDSQHRRSESWNKSRPVSYPSSGQMSASCTSRRVSACLRLVNFLYSLCSLKHKIYISYLSRRCDYPLKNHTKSWWLSSFNIEQLLNKIILEHNSWVRTAVLCPIIVLWCSCFRIHHYESVPL